MKTIIYYFTGTGNSLAAARKIAAALGDCEARIDRIAKRHPRGYSYHRLTVSGSSVLCTTRVSLSSLRNSPAVAIFPAPGTRLPS